MFSHLISTANLWNYDDPYIIDEQINARKMKKLIRM